MCRQLALLALLIVTLSASRAIAVTYDWVPIDDQQGGYEYIVQVEPQLVAAAQAGQLEAIESNVPQYLGRVRRIRVVLGGNHSASALADKQIELTSDRSNTPKREVGNRHRVAKPPQSQDDERGEHSVLKRHTVRQPITGGQAAQGFTPSTQLRELEQGFKQATGQMNSAGQSIAEGFQNGLQQSENALRTAQQTLGGQQNQPRTTIGSELLNGAQNLRNRTQDRLSRTGDAIEGTAENLRDGVKNLLTAPRQLLGSQSGSQQLANQQTYPQPAAPGSGQYKQFSYLTDPTSGAATNAQNGSSTPAANNALSNTAGNNSPSWLTPNGSQQPNYGQLGNGQPSAGNAPSAWQQDSRGFVSNDGSAQTGLTNAGQQTGGQQGSNWNGPQLGQDYGNQGMGNEYGNQQQPWNNNQQQPSGQQDGPQYDERGNFVGNDRGQNDERAFVPLVGSGSDRQNSFDGMVPVRSVGADGITDQQDNFADWDDNNTTNNTGQYPYGSKNGANGYAGGQGDQNWAGQNGAGQNWNNQNAGNAWGDSPTGNNYASGQLPNQWNPNYGNNALPPLAGNPAMQNPAMQNPAGGLPPLGGQNQQQPQFNAGVSNTGGMQTNGIEAAYDPKRSFNHTVLASLACIGSLFGNFFLGMSYLDVRNKYQTALRRTVRTFSRSDADD